MQYCAIFERFKTESNRFKHIRMRRIYFMLFALLLTTVAVAQKQMSIEDAVTGRWSYLYPRHSIGMPQWRNNSELTYLKNDTLWVRQAKNGKQTVLTTTDEVRSNIEGEALKLSRFPRYFFGNENELVLNSANTYAIFNVQQKSVETILTADPEGERVDFSFAGRKLAYTKGADLYLYQDGKEKAIAESEKEGVVYGQEVHRREFGISKGTFWSPSGKYLAFYRKDESMVKDYPLVDYMTREAEPTPEKYPMAGMASHQVTIGIYNTETEETTYLQSGTPDEHYLTNIAWGPNEQYIYVAELNREQNHMQLNQYQVKDGAKLKTLFEEQSKTYVEPQFPIQFQQSNNEQFYYLSRKDGWFHLYLYNTSGEQISQLTQGDWEVTEFYGADKKDQYAYFQATKESPLDRNIYRVALKSGKIEKLDATAGVHAASFSANFSYFSDNWSATNIPGRIDLRTNTGKEIEQLSEAPNTLADYELGENKIVTIKAADGKTDLYSRLILPNNFDPNEKYPVLVYVYGGPHVQLIDHSWHNGANWWFYYMASKGYIVYTVDSRGSANRGGAFEEVIHRQLGIEETKDQMKGVEYLKSLPYVNQDRIGVQGWSFGGFMTLNLMTREADTFKVGVAGGPVVDWSMYEIMYGERYMDMPQENPEGYKESNMLNHVNQLKGKLMLIHGAQDNVVVMQHSFKFLRECIEQGKPVDFFVYPTHQHNVRGKDRVHLMNKISQYFFDYL